jgi:nitroreductase
VELREVIAQRRMVRSFDGTPVPVDQLENWCADALRAPTAGNSAGTGFTIIPFDRVPDFFHAATDPQWRETAPRADALQRAGAVVLSWSEPRAYTERYRENDKASSGLGEAFAWPLPYWHTDAAMATMQLLLLVEDAGYGATIWGAFRNVDRIAQMAQWDTSRVLFASVLVGQPDGNDPKSSSLSRRTASRTMRVERVEP